MALKNLGAIIAKEGDSLRALYYLRRPYQIDHKDPQTVYGLAYAYLKLGDAGQAQKHFQDVLDMRAPKRLQRLARDGLRRSPPAKLKARGPRLDAVFYLLDAMKLFRGRSMDQVREITFEIGMLGRHGLDINEPKEIHILRSLSGMTSPRWSLYASLRRVKMIEPEMDMGKI